MSTARSASPVRAGNISLEQIAERYTRLKRNLGVGCIAERALGDPQALLLNRSAD